MLTTSFKTLSSPWTGTSLSPHTAAAIRGTVALASGLAIIALRVITLSEPDILLPAIFTDFPMGIITGGVFGGCMGLTVSYVMFHIYYYGVDPALYRESWRLSTSFEERIRAAYQKYSQVVDPLTPSLNSQIRGEEFFRACAQLHTATNTYRQEVKTIRGEHREAMSDFVQKHKDLRLRTPCRLTTAQKLPLPIHPLLEQALVYFSKPATTA